MPSETNSTVGETHEEQLNHLKMLLDVSRKVASQDTLDMVLETLVTLACEQTGALRGTLFLNDDTTDELFSRVATGLKVREIRMMNDEGLAGSVFHSGKGEVIDDVYADKRFNKSVDLETGFKTDNLLCVPIRTAKNEVIGVAQLLNKKDGFETVDLDILQGITTQCAITLQSLQLVEKIEKSRQKEVEFLNIISDMTSELELSKLLNKVMTEATRMLEADRSTLFLNDEKTNELFSHVGAGLTSFEIRLPNNAGIAGAVFTSGKTINIPHAYADLRFNPSFDKQTGYFTRSMLAVPVVNKTGKVIGVTQVLNKSGGPFDEEDESRLKAFTAQIAISLENAKLFSDVQSIKNYNQAMLQSMANGVITIDTELEIKTCNAAAATMIGKKEGEIVKQTLAIFGKENQALIDKLTETNETQAEDELIGVDLTFGESTISTNLTFLPLRSGEGKDDHLGSMVMIEDITAEKAAKSTLSRYMDPMLADQMMSGGSDDIMGGLETTATVLFSDVRGFTTITETLGAQGTVALLNEYFELMVDCITEQGGMLDKFIGDAIMAAFGIPMAHDDDEDRAMRCSINMITRLWDWNAERKARGELPVEMGIGLNTDSIVAGNIGSRKRMDYTMIGDGVNLAARLESACKQYHARLLLSEYTVAKLNGVYRLREIDRVIVKGKTEPVNVFECLDYHNNKTFPNLNDAVGYFNDGIKLYRGMEWDRSFTAFEKAIKANPIDPLANDYLIRCSSMKANPPSDDWDGVNIMTSK